MGLITTPPGPIVPYVISSEIYVENLVLHERINAIDCITSFWCYQQECYKQSIAIMPLLFYC